MARGRSRDERGFTIIETMAATLILAVAFLGLAGVHALSSRAQSLGNNQGLATFLANQQIELMRRSTFAGVVSANSTAVVQGVTFNVQRQVTDTDVSKRVTVTVSWNERMGPRTISEVSLVSQVTNP